MERYKYKALNKSGRPIRGVISAMSENDLYNQLQSAGLDLVTGEKITEKKTGFMKLTVNKIKLRDLIQLFIHLEQMQSAGVPLLEALNDIRDNSENDHMRDIMSDVLRDVEEGLSLSEAMNKHPKIFKSLYISIIKSGEETGDLTASYRQLEAYLKWVDNIQSKIRKATRYPIVVTAIVLGAIVFLMSWLVPQVVGFLQYLDFDLPWFTRWLIATSDFFVNPAFHIFGIPIHGALIVLATPVLLFLSLFGLRRLSDGFAYRIDSLYLRLPIAGDLIRKITIARYSQTFAALFTSGVDVISALKSSRETVTNLALADALETVEENVKSGSKLSDALNIIGEFPGMVISMVKVGEESGNLAHVLNQVSEFYTRDVNEAIEAMIEMIQPTLTVILAVVIVWIAAGSLGPIYINLPAMTANI